LKRKAQDRDAWKIVIKCALEPIEQWMDGWESFVTRALYLLRTRLISHESITCSNFLNFVLIIVKQNLKIRECAKKWVGYVTFWRRRFGATGLAPAFWRRPFWRTAILAQDVLELRSRDCISLRKLV